MGTFEACHFRLLTVLVSLAYNFSPLTLQVTSMTVDSSPPQPGWVTDLMTWTPGTGNAGIQWYGFLDSHTAMGRYYVTINGRMASALATAQTVNSLTIAAGLVAGQRYRLALVGVNNAGLSTAVMAVVEAIPGGQLNTLREVCPTTALCEKQYQVPANDSGTNGCTPRYGVSDGLPRSCVCVFSVTQTCLDVTVDNQTPGADVWANLQLGVYDGFQLGTDLDYQPFTGVLGGTWQVRPDPATTRYLCCRLKLVERLFIHVSLKCPFRK